MSSVYQPSPGPYSSTAEFGLIPKNSSVSFGWRAASRSAWPGRRCGPARIVFRFGFGASTSAFTLARTSGVRRASSAAVSCSSFCQSASSLRFSSAAFCSSGVGGGGGAGAGSAITGAGGNGAGAGVGAGGGATCVAGAHATTKNHRAIGDEKRMAQRGSEPTPITQAPNTGLRQDATILGSIQAREERPDPSAREHRPIVILFVHAPVHRLFAALVSDAGLGRGRHGRVPATVRFEP